MNFDVEYCRRQFPALRRRVEAAPAVYLDGPGGSQVPEGVVQAVGDYLTGTNANAGGEFATSRESDALISEARRAVADLLRVDNPECVVFGANMTTLVMSLSRALAKTWGPGDEILVTDLDHEANIGPWVHAARDAGATVRSVGVHLEDCTLDLDDFHAKLSPKTRLVAVGCASNAVGTLNPVRLIVGKAHAVKALVFLDAVHYAPHARIDITDWGCDFLACSPYKFFGPHVGILWGKRTLLEQLPVDKLRCVSEQLPDRWMTGTPNQEGIAGALAAIEYLADLGRHHHPEPTQRPEALDAAFHAIQVYERSLAGELLDGLRGLSEIEIFGLQDPHRLDQRLPTLAFKHRVYPSVEVARLLAELGIFVWSGHHYAQRLAEKLEIADEGSVRAGLLHYNTSDEVQRLLGALAEL